VGLRLELLFIGQAEGVAELMVFYCERAAGFSNDVGLQDGGYFDALVRMFEQALKAIAALPESARPALLERLDKVRNISHNTSVSTGSHITFGNSWMGPVPPDSGILS